MAPIAPILFVQLWAGAAAFVRPRWRCAAGGVLLAGILAINAVPYVVEVIVRRAFGDFYAVARRGAFGELVDIGAYLQSHAARGDVVWVNWPPPSARPPDATFAPDRRIVQFLSDRDVQFISPGGRDGAVLDPRDRDGLAEYLAQVRGDWAIVYFSRLPWPSYHLPLRVGRVQTGGQWWGLYHRDPVSGAFRPVRCPIDRKYVRGIPGWND
jgi:hypothetical protein